MQQVRTERSPNRLPRKGQPVTAHTEADFDELLQLLHLMPVGVLKFTPDGTLVLRNAMASQLLMPLLGEPALDNIFFALRHLCPELAANITAFQAPAGTIMDQRRIEGRAGPKQLTLSLSITRINVTTYLAIIRDISRLTDMATFAFAGSDLLIDMDGDGLIGWAGGAFQPLLDIAPGQAIGRPLSDLIAPRDRELLAKTLLTGTRGRVSPTILRLANRGETRCVVSGLAVDGPSKRFFVTIGRPPDGAGEPNIPLKPVKDFGIEAENWVRGGQTAVLGLLDVRDWGQTTAGLDKIHLDCLMREIGRLAGDSGSNALVLGQVGDGRFGVLGPVGTDLGRLGNALQDLVASFSPGGHAMVQRNQVDLNPEGLTLTESVQALRIALSRLGSTGAAAAGLEGGLAGIIHQAHKQKQTLATIIESGRFTLLYQPVVSLVDQAIHHHESLLRPETGSHNPAGSPQEFVTMVEAVGLSVALDLAVLRCALATIRESHASVAVNVSGLSMAESGFADHLVKAAASFPPGRLLIELTETAEIADLPAVAARIASVRAAGVPVCLDDFGAGSASFRYLRDLRVDLVKIDGAYVQAATQSPQGRAFVGAMRELATSTGAKTVAEMIETEEEAALMRSLGVHFGQGWLFGKPAAIALAPPSKLAKWRY